MTKLGNINFNDYESDDTIGSNIYTSSQKNKNHRNNVKIIDLDSNKSSRNYNSKIDQVKMYDTNNQNYKVHKYDIEDDKNNYTDESDFSFNFERSKYRIEDCDIITYDNSIDYKKKEKKKIKMKKRFHKAKKIMKNNHSRISSLFCSDLSDNDLSDNDLSDNDLTDNICSSYISCPKFYEGYKVPACNDNICIEKCIEKPECIKVCESNIGCFGQLDIVGKKLEKIISSFKTISYLIQYYLRILEQLKIQISQHDISHSVRSCVETTNSLFSYLKAEIERNKPFVLDDKYHNRDGYCLTNGITKIYYIEKIQIKLLDNGECIIGLFNNKNNTKTFELGDNYIDANYEGDLYNMIEIAKQKAIHFNKCIEAKHMKASSIFNLHLIYLNKYKR